MNIIDAHAHIFPAKIAQAAVEATAEFYENAIPGHPMSKESMIHHDGMAEELLTAGKAGGIDKFLVFSTATTPRQVESVNNFIAAQCEAHPEFIGAGTMHIDYPDFEKEIDRAKALGLVGIKLHPDIQRFRLDDERLFPLYEILGSRHMFLIAHTGDYRYEFSNPKRMEKIAKMFPQTKFIGAHFGGWSEWNVARDLLVLDNVYVDTSSTYGFTGPEAMKQAFGTFDPTHIFFGSDYPMWDPETELKSIYELGLTDEQLEDVLGGNFERFLQEL